MLGVAYKIGCVVMAILGLVAAFPLGAYASIMGIANPGSPILLMVVAPVASLGWAVYSALRTLKLTSPVSFIAPSIAAAMGIGLMAIGLPFAQNPPSY